MTLTQGQHLGHYEILRWLGGGGMGDVYLTRDGKLGREVAIKLLKADRASDPAWLARFEREARLLASLNHAHVAVLHGLEEAGGERFLVMEFVEGQTLDARLAAGPLSLATALDLAHQIAEALEAAHERGVIHRDLKPGNVMLTPEGKIKVLDFGLATSAVTPRETPPPDECSPTQVYQARTEENQIVGTAAYMSPEQAQGHRVDRRCDIWAFGCVLYELLAGKPVFSGTSALHILSAVVTLTPDWTALPADVPVRIRELLRRCLIKDPRQRLRDIGDARLEIQEAIAELGRPMPPVAGPSWRWGYPVTALAAVMLAIPLGMWLPRGSDRKPPEPPGTERSVPMADEVLPRPADWPGEVLIGGTTRAFGPRISPDGQQLAFVVLHDGVAQVGLMNLRTGRWRPLTLAQKNGGVNSVCWSRGGERIYYDRFFTVPTGVFSVAPDDFPRSDDPEQPIVSRAQAPQVLSDGSLLVTRMDDDGNYYFWRHWPSGKRRDGKVLDRPFQFNLGGEEAWWPSPVRAVPGGKPRALFCGRKIDTREGNPPRMLYLLDVDKGEEKALCGPVHQDLVSLAVARDGQHGYVVLQEGDSHRVMRIDLSGKEKPRPVLTLMNQVYGLDFDLDGTLYLDQFRRPPELVRYALAGGEAERVGSLTRGKATPPIELPGGAVLLPNKVLGRDRLLVAMPGKEPRPLLPEEETRPPVALVGEDRLAFVAGSGKEARVVLARIQGGEAREARHLEQIGVAGLTALAGSYDGRKLYCIHNKMVREVDLELGAKAGPRPICPGDGVAVQPDGKELIVQQFHGQGVRLFRVPLLPTPGTPIEVKLDGPMPLAPDVIGDRAVGSDGQVLVAVAKRTSWFWFPALLHLKSGKVAAIEVKYEGDLYPSNRAAGGRVISMAWPIHSDIWRLAPGK